MIDILDARPEEPVPERIRLAFAPVHKRAFGMAVGLAVGVLLFGATVYTVMVLPEEGPGLYLLSEYFYGYSVTWEGALVGLFWGGFVGFVAGWFAAFTRNLALATLIFLGRTKAELQATRDFLDHI